MYDKMAKHIKNERREGVMLTKRGGQTSASITDKYLTIKEIADLYGQTIPAVRRILNHAIESDEDSKNAIVVGKGRAATTYPWSFMVKAFGKAPDTSIGTVPRSMFGNESRAPSVKIITEADGKSPIVGLITSRRKCRAEYDKFVGYLARTGQNI